MPEQTDERPFLLLTKRRSGGTALMRLMSRFSSFPSVQHEPFNPVFRWGHIVQAFRETGDHAAMVQAVADCLTDTPNIKHCYEFLPLPLTFALIDACAARGYAVFHLDRLDEVARLRSLGIALATGAWGPKAAREVLSRGDDRARPVTAVDLDRIERCFDKDRRQQAQVFAHLQRRGLPVTELVFEDLYRRDGQQGERLRAIADAIGGRFDPSDRFLRAFLDSRGQNSAQTMALLPDRAAFEALLDRLRRKELRRRAGPKARLRAWLRRRR